MSATSKAKVVSLPMAIEPLAPASLDQPGGHHGGLKPITSIVPAERFDELVPTQLTRREREIGKEAVCRAAVQEAHYRLQTGAAVMIGQMHDHTHRALVAGVRSMNARVRALDDLEDREELAAITAEQKSMYVRHQLSLLEAGSYRVAAEVDRSLYLERRRGVIGWFLGD